jgi:DeoR family fructose operon transcriptional repressor
MEKLEKQGLIKRTYGGAILLDGPNSEIPLDVRTHEHEEEKSKIGSLAAAYISQSNIIMLDASTTVLAMLKYLHSHDDLTVITNGIRTVTYFAEVLNKEVYCTGGILRESSLTLSGYHAEDFVSHYKAEKFFFSCRAVSPTDGIFDFSDEDAHIKQKMLSRSDEKYLLCDSSKIEQKAFCHVADFDDIDYFITDKKPHPPLLAVLEKAHVKVVYPE